MDLIEDAYLGFGREINQNVSKEDDVHRRHRRRPGFDEIYFAKLDRLANVFFDLPLKSTLREVLQQHWHGQPAINLGLIEDSFLGLLQNRRR